MGGFFHFVDLKQGKMARKIGTQKRNVGGLEAPRNSLELPIGTYHGYYSPQDDGLRKYQETDDWSETDSYTYPTETPMKKLISDEISKRPKSRSNAPSIVARLMGVDTLPLNTKPVAQTHDLSKEKLIRSSSVGSALSPSKSFRHTSLNSFTLFEDSDLDEWSGSKITKKPKPREHPQEEELRKFKKEFEAWQSARFKECSKIVEHEHDIIPDQLMAQVNLNKKKMALYSNENFEPTKIVILRPGFDNISNNSEDPWAAGASSSCASEDRNNIEDFLDEVKERLKCELHGKSLKTGLFRGGGIETPYSEKPSDPKQIAKRIAKQVRDSVTNDLNTNLIRSESTRSYGTNSSEFVSRDTRRLLSERLRNVLKRESNSIHSDENDIQSKSFRCKPDDHMILQSNLSPINLVRSLSAPVSGTSFGKLLLEDRHVVTGAHIRRKHEVNEKLTMKVKKQRKDKFNLKERVSSLKYSLSLRARLFGRKIHSTSEFRDNDRSFVKDIMNGTTVMMNFPDRPENATEVPPSPASVCSSINEDFYRAAYCASPITPGASTLDENDIPQAFRDISSNLNELRKQLHQLENGQSEETANEEQPFESNMSNLEDEEEAYIQDLLMASGIYNNNSFDKSLTRFDTYAKPISNRVFDQVEESYKNNNNNKPSTVDHKVLLDLLNEVLSTLLVPTSRKSIGTLVRLPHGNNLLDEVWRMLDGYLHPHVDKSFYFFDSMVARDLKSMPWSELVSEDIDALAKEMECQIIRDLVEETVKDMRDDYITR